MRVKKENQTVIMARYIREQLSKFKIEMRKEETEVEYREYCEGLIDAARACLAVITGD
jgi:hypothetical protein